MKIFVATGSRAFSFSRLIKAVDEAALALSFSKEDIFAQIGTSEYVPEHISFERFLEKNVYDEKINSCDILIAPAAAGTVFSSLKARKKIIVVTRLHEHGEIIDNHQIELATILAEQNFVLYAEDLACLPEKITAAQNHTFDVYSPNPERTVRAINDWIAETVKK